LPNNEILISNSNIRFKRKIITGVLFTFVKRLADLYGLQLLKFGPHCILRTLNIMRRIIILILAICLSITSQSQTINASQAKEYIGKNVTVCDQVAGVKHATTVNREPTFLDFGAKYPNEVFTALVWGDDLSPPDSNRRLRSPE
jgi:hypothetical protein